MSPQSGEQPAMSDAPAASGSYEGVGHSLRVVRERRGLELADVSARLRIRRHYLEAIETGRFGELPGAVYINGFLRQYAEFLGLDADQVLKTYQNEADAPLQRPVLNFPVPRPEDRTPRLWLIGGALILAIAVYALWYRHQEAVRLGHDLIEAVPARLADLVPSPTPIAQTPPAAGPAAAPSATPAPAAVAPVQTATSQTAAPQPAAPQTAVSAVAPAAPPAATSPAGPAAGLPAPDAAAPAVSPVSEPTPAAPAAADAGSALPAAGTDTAAAAPASDQTAAAAPAPTPAPTPTVFGAPDATDARVRLEATAPAWIQVRGPNNEQIFTRLLHAGETYVVPPDRSGLTLLTGNAGGLRVVVDGRTLPPLGATGEVKRGIPLDADQLKAADGGGQGSQG